MFHSPTPIRINRKEHSAAQPQPAYGWQARLRRASQTSSHRIFGRKKAQEAQKKRVWFCAFCAFLRLTCLGEFRAAEQGSIGPRRADKHLGKKMRGKKSELKGRVSIFYPPFFCLPALAQTYGHQPRTHGAMSPRALLRLVVKQSSRNISRRFRETTDVRIPASESAVFLNLWEVSGLVSPNSVPSACLP